jgi:hypothetical protein
MREIYEVMGALNSVNSQTLNFLNFLKVGPPPMQFHPQRFKK